MDVAVVVPTLNAADRLPKMAAAIRCQTLQPAEFLVIDSNSSDGTAAIAKAMGASVLVLGEAKFNHGGTRQLAFERTKAEIVIFLTDDAFPADDLAIENICAALCWTPDIGMAYGRQLPSPGATPLAHHHRNFNYPAAKFIKRRSDIPRLGMRAFFASDSFSAYRRGALNAVGGFPPDTIFGEDAHVAARMLLAGYAVAYTGDAKVFHSHNYSLIQDFRRHFDAGVFHARNPWLRRNFGGPGGEGLRFVTSEIAYLLRNGGTRLIPFAILATGMKFLGFHAGKRERHIPRPIKRAIGMYRDYWS